MARSAPGAARGYIGLSRHERLASFSCSAVLLALAAMLAWSLPRAVPAPPRAVVGALKLFSVPAPPSPPPLVAPPRPSSSAPALAQVAHAPAPAAARRAPPSPSRTDVTETATVALGPAAPIPLPAGLTDTAEPGVSLGEGLTGVAGGLGGGSGQGGSGQDRRPRFTRAEWIRRPSRADLRRAWPPGERPTSRPVTVELVCAVLPDGHPARCRIARETLPGHGFGAAAIRVAQATTVRPILRDGQRTGLGVIIPLTFGDD